MRRFRRRRIVVGVAAIVLGAATTVGVSWALACADVDDAGERSDQCIRPERGPIQRDYFGGPANGISACVHSDRGRVIVSSGCFGPDFIALVGIPMSDGVKDATEPPDRIVPACVRSFALPWLFGDPWPRGGDEQRREIQASGWPCIAMLAEYRQTAWFTYEDRFGIVLRGKRSMGPAGLFRLTYRRVLPLLPLWPGFALDTMAFGLVWLPVLLVPGAVRAILRRRRQECRGCGYDLRGLPGNAPCPECGRGVEVISASTRGPPARSDGRA